ncbi:hypothetical protein PHYPSEUDO_006574 [Phytophthora pseudosyringae]|uniref:Uncharacterized protein n=1 Tax=Phytophthora pseudosyringae TaxID=221518 RepID=A0A8T1VI71_9STRA|nr:hypothetical protein PHYPSEUDO_006574 [Phytophthora pseudosyringae]
MKYLDRCDREVLERESQKSSLAPAVTEADQAVAQYIERESTEQSSGGDVDGVPSRQRDMQGTNEASVSDTRAGEPDISSDTTADEQPDNLLVGPRRAKEQLIPTSPHEASDDGQASSSSSSPQVFGSPGALSPRRNLAESFAAESESGSEYVQSESEHSVVSSNKPEEMQEDSGVVAGAVVDDPVSTIVKSEQMEISNIKQYIESKENKKSQNLLPN